MSSRSDGHHLLFTVNQQAAHGVACTSRDRTPLNDNRFSVIGNISY